MKRLHISFAIAVMGMGLLPAAGVGQGSTMQPGKWEISTTVVSVDMPGAPPQVAQMMAGKTTVLSQCITPDMVSKGETAPTRPGCTVTHSPFGIGLVTSKVVCQTNGGTMTATNKGVFSPTSYSMDGKIEMTGKTSMTEVIKTSGKRVGAC
jgi:hypothetical protein